LAAACDFFSIMLCRIKTSAISGISAVSVDVEVEARDSTREGFTIIGMADASLRESRDRVSSALRYSGFEVNPRILVNLSPAELRKEGSSFDLAIALGILHSSAQIKAVDLEHRAFFGELSLDGKLKPVRGMVALTIEALRAGVKEVVVPVFNWDEAAIISGVKVIGLNSLLEVVSYLEGRLDPVRPANGNGSTPCVRTEPSLLEVGGQATAKRAMLVAAAGGHNLLMIGPPGCGKSMLAERFSSLLPSMDRREILEVARIHSVVGLPIKGFLGGRRPFRNPHYVISEAGLVGGGTIPRPGEVSLAHHGVLFLDEFPEFNRSAIEALRSPLEKGTVSISRAKGSLVFPASFQLLAAMNPCPCGRLGAAGLHCQCSRSAIQAYLKKLSQPILDRIDLQIELEAVSIREVTESRGGTDLEEQEQRLRDQVAQAHQLSLERSGKKNARLQNKEVFEHVSLSSSARRLLEQAASKGALSARSFVRILKVSRTIADLEESKDVSDAHVAEALGLRGLERIERYCG